MTMPIATQIADAVTTLKGRLYAKAGELYFRKSGNGTIYQLTPPGGGGGPALAPVIRAPGASNLNAGEFVLCDTSGGNTYTLTLTNGATNGDQCGLVVTGIDGENVTVLGNIGGNPPGFSDGFQYRAATYIWSAQQSQWWLYSIALRQVA